MVVTFLKIAAVDKSTVGEYSVVWVYEGYINIQWCISQTQQNVIRFITVLGQHVSILIESSSGPSKIHVS